MFQDDQELLRAFRAGERDALEKVYRHYLRDIEQLVRFGFSIGGKAQFKGVTSIIDRQDLIQEVFIHAFREQGRAAYDASRPYRPYLLRVARNVVIDRLRRPTKELLTDDGPSALFDLEMLIERNAPVPDAEASLDWKRKSDATAAYYKSASAQEQRFIELRFVQGMSQDKVAESMGVTRRKVRSLEEKSLKGLKRALSKAGYR